MHDTLKRFKLVTNKVNEIIIKKQLKTNPQIIAISKTFPLEKITPLIDLGHIHFGENKVQEAEDKWLDIKKRNLNLKLHMVGKLQTNKAKKAVQLFDYIHSLDNAKLANKVCQYEKELNKKVNLFIQINVGVENKKSGILINDLGNFYDYCTKKLNLNIIGLMCLPPANSDPSKFFKILKDNSEKFKLPHISMGMSGDYVLAIENGSTFLRIGTEIFGERKTS